MPRSKKSPGAGHAGADPQLASAASRRGRNSIALDESRKPLTDEEWFALNPDRRYRFGFPSRSEQGDVLRFVIRALGTGDYSDRKIWIGLKNVPGFGSLIVGVFVECGDLIVPFPFERGEGADD